MVQRRGQQGLTVGSHLHFTIGDRPALISLQLKADFSSRNIKKNKLASCLQASVWALASVQSRVSISHSFTFKSFGQKNGDANAAEQSAVFRIKGDYTATLQSRYKYI